MERPRGGRGVLKNPRNSDDREGTTNRKKRKFNKEKIETFEKLKIVLTNMFEEVIDPVFHSGSRGLATKGFGTTPPVDIIATF